MIKHFTKSGGHSRMDFLLDSIRVNMGTVISFRDTVPYQAMMVAKALKEEYENRFQRSTTLKVVKTDNIPMGIRKGQVLVQIGFQDVYNKETDIMSAKHFIEMYNQGSLGWIVTFIQTNFPTIDISSLAILGTKVKL